MFELRDYQKKGVKAGIRVMTAPKKKSVLVAPTGGGKSIYIAEIVKSLPDIPIVVLQPSKELLRQNYAKYVKVGGEASMYCASLKEKTIKKKAYTTVNGELKRCDEISRVTYATIGSIKKEINKLRSMGLKHIIVDEVHLQSKVGSQMREFIKQLKVTNVLGLTATPLYLEGSMAGSRLVMMNRSYGAMFRDICHVTQISELVKNKYWTPFKYKIMKTDESDLQLNSSGSDYTEYSQKRYYESNDLKGKVVEEVNRAKKEGRKRILVFVPSISEANELYGLIPNSAVVHSKMSTKERDFMIEEFTNGDIPVAINVNVLAVGYDNPEIDYIITTRPTSSIAVFYQQIGRGCRLHPEKEDCVITDFSGNTNRFGRVEELEFKEIREYGWGLFNGKNELLSDYPIMTKVKPTVDSLIEGARREREQKEKKNKVDLQDGSIKLWFGKHNGKTVRELKQKEKSYLIWMYENFDFNGSKMMALKTHIERELMISKTKSDMPF